MNPEQNVEEFIPEEPVINKVIDKVALQQEQEEMKQQMNDHIEAKEQMRNATKRKINQLLDLLTDIEADVEDGELDPMDFIETKNVMADVEELIEEMLDLQKKRDRCKTRIAEIEEDLKM